MVSHSGKAGVWFSFSTGHMGFRGSVPFMLQESMSNAASAEGKDSVLWVIVCICKRFFFLPVFHFKKLQFNYKKRYDLKTSLTINIWRKIPKYDKVRFINRPTDNPVQPILIVDEDALFGHTIRHHPDAQQEHEEEHIHHLEDKRENSSQNFSQWHVKNVQ